MAISNGKVIEQCYYCGKFVTLNKRLFGSLHLCVSPEEREQIERQQQQNYQSLQLQKKANQFLASVKGANDPVRRRYK